MVCRINPLQAGVADLYPLETAKNLFMFFFLFSEGIDKQNWAVMG